MTVEERNNQNFYQISVPFVLLIPVGAGPALANEPLNRRFSGKKKVLFFRAGPRARLSFLVSFFFETQILEIRTTRRVAEKEPGMMQIKAKLVKVDTSGFCGRELHPSESDEGKVFEVISVTTEHSHADTMSEPINDRPSAEKFLIQAAGVAQSKGHTFFYQVFTVTDGNRVLTLIEHEIELFVERA